MNCLPALFLIIALHALPLRQNILYPHLACDLLFNLLRLRNHQADLPVGFHGQYSRHLLGRLYAQILHPKLLHDDGGRLILRALQSPLCRILSCRLLLRMRCLSRNRFPGPGRPFFLLPPHVFSRQIPISGLFLPGGFFRRIFPSVVLRINFLSRQLLPGQRTGLLPVQIPNLTGGAKEDLRLHLFLRHPLRIRFLRKLLLLRSLGKVVCHIPVPLHHGRYNAAGNGVLRFLILQHFPQPFGQFLLQIDGVILSHIHGLDLDLDLL